MSIFTSSFLKITAMSAMVADHAGVLFFPEQEAWRIAGRLSFPLFAFLIAEGYRRSGDVKKYFTRLLVFAFISQLPFCLFLKTAGFEQGLNIFFTLSAGLACLSMQKKLPYYLSIPGILAAGIAAQLLGFDYGAYGILMVLAGDLILSSRRLPALIIIFAASILYSDIQVYAIAGLPLMLMYNGHNGIKLPRRLLYWFYPAHLLVLTCLEIILRLV